MLSIGLRQRPVGVAALGTARIRRNASSRARVGLLVAGLSVAAGLFVVKAPLVVFGMLLVFVVGATAWSNSDRAIVAWLVAIVALPQWWAVAVPGVAHVGLTAAFGIVLLAVTLCMPGGTADLTPGFMASISFGFCFLLLSAFLLDLPGFALRDVLLLWFPAILIGYVHRRVVVRFLPYIAIVIAVWAIVEFLSGWHPFEAVGPTSTWQPIQRRGGLARSEGAFGHAIAMAAGMVLGVPFITQLRRWRHWAMLVIALGVATTVTRTGVLCLALTVLFCWWVQVDHRGFWRTVLIYCIISGALLSQVIGTGIGASDASSSDAYRSRAIAVAQSGMRPFGLSPDAYLDAATGAAHFSGIVSIDNTFLYWGLLLGWVPVVLVALALLPMVWRALRRRGDRAAIAVVGQLPALLSATLMTSWQILFLVVVGAAVSGVSEARDNVSPRGSVP